VLELGYMAREMIRMFVSEDLARNGTGTVAYSSVCACVRVCIFELGLCEWVLQFFVAGMYTVLRVNLKLWARDS
jgi:hypothetical protein